MNNRKLASSPNLDVYLADRSSANRSRLLRQDRQLRLPLDLACDLLAVGLPESEERLILSRLCRDDADAFEDLLTANLLNWAPNTAAFAFRLWVKETEHKLWPRMLSLAVSPNLTQRLTYLLVENSQLVGGALAIRTILEHVDVSDLSEKTTGLLLRRSVQWSVEHELLIRLCETLLTRTIDTPYPNESCLNFALGYLARFRPQQIENLLASPMGNFPWADFVKSIGSVNTAKFKIKRKKSETDGQYHLRLQLAWPPYWALHNLDVKTLDEVIESITDIPLPQDLSPPPCRPIDWEMFAGIPASVTAEVANNCRSPYLTKVLHQTSLEIPSSHQDICEQFMAAHHLQSPFQPIYLERNSTRSRVIDRLYYGQSHPPTEDGTVWDCAQKALHQRDEANYRAVCTVGTAVPGVFLPTIFRIVETFAGFDAALPFVSNYLNSTEQSEIGAIISALDGIGTKTATGYLVQLLQASRLSVALKTDICQMLSTKELSDFQNELRQAVDTLSQREHELTTSHLQLLDQMKSLLSVDQEKTADVAGDLTSKDLNRIAEQKITGLLELPAESQRALRTAVLILETLKGRSSLAGVDISPAVDMQYKALEILYRNLFEDLTLQMVQSVHLKRKLDSIGYVRFHKPSTEAFENYISSLPTIRDIPMFSRFKLQKIMRAIAMYRPGKRFTLDGLKAFAIFFLVFGREDCRYKIGKSLPLKITDEELFSLCRDLHVFQDIRNRAVHEGLPVQALKDVEAMWNMTSSIISRTRALIQ